MPAYDGLLMRDSLEDTGVVPSPGYPYFSPDLICHEEVVDPKSFFSSASSVASDPNQPAQTGSAVNFIYVRAKNLGQSARSGQYITLYRASSSLFMRPSIWKDNKLRTMSGQDYVTLDTLQPGAVGVGNDKFVLSGLRTNLFCLIGIAGNSPTPPIPDAFSSYGDYIVWVRQNQNTCGRNLTLAHDFRDRQYERLDEFSNPYSYDVPVLFKVTASAQLPSGTIFGASSPALRVDRSQRVDDGRVLTASAMCPAGFSGTVNAYGSLPSAGQQWPTGATIRIDVYVGEDQSHPAAMFAESWQKLGVQPHDVPGLAANGVLVRLGTCATRFIAA